MLILIQALLIAQATSVNPTPPAASGQVPKEKLVCHMEDVGQSRIAQRICHTKAEWDELERQSEDDFKSNMSKQNDPGNKPE